MRRQAGFSLFELVLTIMLMGLMAATVSVFISGPILSYIETANRAELVSLAGQSLTQMERDVKASVPNSVRIARGGTILEVLRTQAAIPYKVGASGVPDGLSVAGGFQQAGGQQFFRVQGKFLDKVYGQHPQWQAVVFHQPRYDQQDFNRPENGLNAYGEGRSFQMTVFGRDGQPRNVPYFGHVISPKGVNVVPGDQPFLLGLTGEGWQPDGTQDIVALRVPHSFSAHSPNNMLYLVDSPVTYHCDLAAGTLTKYWDYPIQAQQPDPRYSSRMPAGARSALVANRITNCQFSFEAQGADMTLVNLNLQLTTSRGESVTLHQQVHVRNDP